MRIAVLADSSISHDTRVQKQLKTLVANGYDVTAFGIGQAASLGPIRYPELDVDIYLGFKNEIPLQEKYLTKKAAFGKSNTRNAEHKPKKKTKHKFHRFILYLAIFFLGLALGEPAYRSYALAGGGVLVLALLLLFARKQLRKPKPRKTLPPERPKASVERDRSRAESRAEYRREKWAMVRDELVNEVSKHGPFDAIHSHDIIALEAGAILKARSGGKLIWDAHEIYEALGNTEAAALRRSKILENKKSVDFFITINESIAGYYEQHHPELPSPTIVMNATLPSEPIEDDGRLRAAAELPEGSKIVLFQGGFAKERGLEALIGAARDFDPSWFVVLMGWGNLEDKLRAMAAPINEQARADGLPNKVVFLPGAPYSELKYWTAGATLGAIPYENSSLNHLYCTPNKLWEYPVAGVPFIATDLEEMSKMVKAYDTGFLIPRDFTSKSISDVVNAITDEILDQKRAACARFSREQNWSRFEPRLLAIYEALGKEEEPLRAAT